jgi:uracil-DNA glycosylase family 4
MPSLEYLEAMYEAMKKFLPNETFGKLHEMALPQSGGKAKANKFNDTLEVEKLKLEEMTPEKLREIDQPELLNSWRRLVQLFNKAKKEKRAIEIFVNRAVFVIDELERRGIDVDKTLPLFREAQKFAKGICPEDIKDAPEEVMVVPDFVSIVGSAVRKRNPNDIDVLYRADMSEDGCFLVRPENTQLAVRNALQNIRSNLELHEIYNPQGSREERWLPVYNLVLRKSKTGMRITKQEDSLDESIRIIENHISQMEKMGIPTDELKCAIDDINKHKELMTTIRKEASPMPGWEEFMSEAPEGDKVEIGCGDSKAEGFTGIDINPDSNADIIHDINQGIPCQDGTVGILRANHTLEHFAEPGKVMKEIYRVLVPGGVTAITVPSTSGEGAFAHPDHKSFWNKSSFMFWTDKDFIEDRPLFNLIHLEERKGIGDLAYIDAVLQKPLLEEIEKAVTPFRRFVPTKPEVAGFTEAFELTDLQNWAKDRFPVTIEEKLNGFRSIVEKQGKRTKMWFEGQFGKNQLTKFPDVDKVLKGINEDFVLDADITIERDGKKLPRPQLMTLNADKPELQENDKVIITVFDLLYRGEDLTDMEWQERRTELENFFQRYLDDKPNFRLSQAKVAKNNNDLRRYMRWAFGQDRSEGLVAKALNSKYEPGGTNEWFKLKRVAELKVIILQKKETKVKGIFNYWVGLRPSEDFDFTNLTEFKGKQYVNLGKTFSTSLDVPVGKILTIEVLELIPNPERKELALLGGRVIDQDRTRKEPFFVSQAIDIAKRAKVLQKQNSELVPSIGKKNAVIAFIGASPGRTEVARGEPFTGPTGKTLKDNYLEPLGLTREQVFLTNAVPVLLVDDKGSVREPNTQEVKEWANWLEAELESANPGIIVALGQTAKKALGDKADFVLPHPMVIRRFGDSGEVARKIKQIKVKLLKTHHTPKERIKKQQPPKDEGDVTRAEISTRFWNNNWQDMFPSKGGGKWTYMHHWRGLTEDESKLSEKALLDTDNSLHGDIRFETDENLWGFSVFLGKTEDNRKMPSGDRLIDLPPDDNLQGQFKLAQPKTWLNVGKDKPLRVEPAGVGATPEAWAVFNALDSGNYEMGIWKRHLIEVFLKGRKLKGRFLIQFAPVGERRIWIIDRPESQVPLSETKDIRKEIADQKRKKRGFIIWGKPGKQPIPIKLEKPAKQGFILADELLDIIGDEKDPWKFEREIKAKIRKDEIHADIVKADEEKRIVYGVVLEPDFIDSQGDIINAEEVEKASHFFMENSRVIGERHKKKLDAVLVESYTAPQDLEMGNQKVKKGSWIIAVRIDDDKIWEKVKNKELNSFSVGGFGKRTSL